MFWDILIAVGLAADAILMAYLGINVSLHPPNAKNNSVKKAYRLWFLLLGLVAVILTCAQVVRNGIAQHQLIDAIKHNKSNITTTVQNGSVPSPNSLLLIIKERSDN